MSYKRPTQNMSDTPSFFDVDKFRPHIIFCGRIRGRISNTMLIIADAKVKCGTVNRQAALGVNTVQLDSYGVQLIFNRMNSNMPPTVMKAMDTWESQ